jgi:hypothetical protein
LGSWGTTVHYRVCIDTTAPIITDLSDPVGYTGNVFMVRAIVIDNGGSGVAGVYLYWRYAGTADEFTLVTMDMMPTAISTREYYAELLLASTSLAKVEYYIVGIDNAEPNNVARAPTEGVSELVIVDDDPPTVDAITGNITVLPGESVLLTVVATDNIAVAYVKLYFIDVIVAAELEVTMDKVGPTTFTYLLAVDSTQVDDILYFVIVTDAAGNTNRTPSVGTYRLHLPKPPTVTLLSPAADEICTGMYEICWQSSAPDGYTTTVSIYYSADAGAQWHTIVTGYPDVGCYLWNTSRIPDGTDYLLKLYVWNNYDMMSMAISESTFTVYNPDTPRVTLLYPVGKVVCWELLTIEWNATDPDRNEYLELDIYYSADNGVSWHTIARGVANIGYYVWDTRAVPDGSYMLKLVAIDSSSYMLSAVVVSAQPFIINNVLSFDVMISWKPAKERVTVGTQVIITATIKNTCARTLTDIEVEYWIDNLQVGNVTIDVLSPGSRVITNCSWNATIIGLHQIKLRLYELEYVSADKLRVMPRPIPPIPSWEDIVIDWLHCYWWVVVTLIIISIIGIWVIITLLARAKRLRFSSVLGAGK